MPLARIITRAVHELDQGTRYIAAGDFSAQHGFRPRRFTDLANAFGELTDPEIQRARLADPVGDRVVEGVPDDDRVEEVRGEVRHVARRPDRGLGRAGGHHVEHLGRLGVGEQLLGGLDVFFRRLTADGPGLRVPMAQRSAAVHGEDVIVHAMNGHVYVLDRHNGRIRWSYTTGALTAGSKAFTVTASDVAGNTSAASAASI